MLPKLKWVPSPNVSARGAAKVDLIVLHDMEGTYAASIAWFQMAKSQVSAHFCLNDDGTECTQMVHLADKAWAVCAFNSRSVSLEMAGYAKQGYKPELLQAAAEIIAYLAAHLQIPIRHARGGVGPGICSHYDLGAAGGGHSDPSTAAGFMDTFIAAVQAAYDRHDFPQVWDVDDGPAPCRVSAPTVSAPAAIDLDSTFGVLAALEALGEPNPVKLFQAAHGLDADGDPGPATKAAIEKMLSGG